MIKVGDIILSDDIATKKFSCDTPKCKGACCVVGDAGAPVSREEIPVLHKAYRELKSELRPESIQVAEEDGVVIGTKEKGYEISCVNGAECIFVNYDEQDVAFCTIQKAYFEGRFGWEKPISCHLYPVRLKKYQDLNMRISNMFQSYVRQRVRKEKKKELILQNF